MTGSVSGKTSFVLAGVDAGQSKLERAEAVNCKVPSSSLLLSSLELSDAKSL